MPSVNDTIPDSNPGYAGTADTPFSVRPWAAYVLGNKHVAGTDYTSLNDFCGAQGDLTVVSAPVANDYDVQFPGGGASYEVTPFTVGDHLALGAGTIVAVGRAVNDYACFVGAFNSGEAGKGGLSLNILPGTPVQMQTQIEDANSVTATWQIGVPAPAGGTSFGQIMMAATMVTAGSIQGYVQNIAGAATTGAIAKAAGAYTSDRKYRIGASQISPAGYAGQTNVTLVLFFQAALTAAQLAALYVDCKTWLNEHGLGL